MAAAALLASAFFAACKDPSCSGHGVCAPLTFQGTVPVCQCLRGWMNSVNDEFECAESQEACGRSFCSGRGACTRNLTGHFGGSCECECGFEGNDCRVCPIAGAGPTCACQATPAPLRVQNSEDVPFPVALGIGLATLILFFVVGLVCIVVKAVQWQKAKQAEKLRLRRAAEDDAQASLAAKSPRDAPASSKRHSIRKPGGKRRRSSRRTTEILYPGRDSVDEQQLEQDHRMRVEAVRMMSGGLTQDPRTGKWTRQSATADMPEPEEVRPGWFHDLRADPVSEPRHDARLEPSAFSDDDATTTASPMRPQTSPRQPPPPELSTPALQAAIPPGADSRPAGSEANPLCDYAVAAAGDEIADNPLEDAFDWQPDRTAEEEQLYSPKDPAVAALGEEARPTHRPSSASRARPDLSQFRSEAPAPPSPLRPVEEPDEPPARLRPRSAGRRRDDEEDGPTPRQQVSLADFTSEVPPPAPPAPNPDDAGRSKPGRIPLSQRKVGSALPVGRGRTASGGSMGSARPSAALPSLSRRSVGGGGGVESTEWDEGAAPAAPPPEQT